MSTQVETPKHATAVWGLTVEKQWDLLALLFPLLGVLPLLILQAANMWSRPHLQFFPVTILVVAWLCYKELSSEGLAGGLRFKLSIVFAFLTLVIGCTALVLYSPWVSHLALVTTLISWSLTRLHLTAWPRLVALACVLASTVPLPLNQDRVLVGELQSWSSKACAYSLDGFKVPNLLQGNVLQIAGHSLFVEEACSGVTSLYSLVSLALILNVVQRRSLARALCTLLITPILAIIGNILRLLVIALGLAWWEIDLSHGYLHTLLGMVVFTVSGLALISTDVVVTSIFAPIPKLRSDRSLFRRIYNTIFEWPNGVITTQAESSSKERLSFASDQVSEVKTQSLQWKKLSLVTVAGGLYLSLLIPSTVLAANEFIMHEQIFGSPDLPMELAAQFPQEDAMPKMLGADWTRVGYREEKRDTNNQSGQHSHIWQYVKGDQTILVSLDFAFPGWHNLEVCYRNSGWRVGKIEIAKRNDQDVWPWFECQMKNELDLSGHLWYAFFDEKGEPFVRGMDKLGIERRVDRNFWSFWQKPDHLVYPLTFQCQIFIESGPPLTDEQYQELRSLFLEVREVIRAKSLPAIQQLGGK